MTLLNEDGPILYQTLCLIQTSKPPSSGMLTLIPVVAVSQNERLLSFRVKPQYLFKLENMFTPWFNPGNRKAFKADRQGRGKVFDFNLLSL